MLRLIGDQHYDDMVVLESHLVRHARGNVIDRLIVDATETGYADTGARLGALQVARRFVYGRVALLRSASSLNTAIVLLIARRSGKVQHIKVFNTKADALKWLREPLSTEDAGHSSLTMSLL